MSSKADTSNRKEKMILVIFCYGPWSSSRVCIKKERISSMGNTWSWKGNSEWCNNYRCNY